MAVGAMKKLGSNFALSTTGLAGPGGDNFENPIGTVYIGYASKDNAFAKRFLFKGNREQVRQQTVQAALAILIEELNSNATKEDDYENY